MPSGLLTADAAWSDCESVIRGFEDAWQDDERPALESYLPAASPHRTQLLVELVHVDLEFRLRRGEFARAEDYLSRFPELGARKLAVDLLRAEYALRGRYTPPVWAEELLLRFPELSAELRPLAVDTDRPGSDTPSAGGPGRAAAVGLPVIPGYDIGAELGRGGMGVVYKARDLALNRTVAVKTFAAAPGPEARSRFAREAEVIARLDHPHIVPVYEVGEWGRGVPFFAMKCYPGGLDAVPAGPGTDPRGHARAVAAVARAVHHAHQRGVLHRDLKPSNILLDEAGRPHVADFGLAGRFDPADPATRTAAVVGTPAFMAPEQAKNPKAVTTAADVYGLGAVLYQRLTGRPPFQAETALATLHQAATRPPLRPSAVNRGVPRDLETVCLKCLEKEPGRRYGSAAELADDLDRWLKGRPVQARPVSAWGHAWRWVRRHPLLTWLAGVAVAAVAAFVVSLAVGQAAMREKEVELRAAFGKETEAKCEVERLLGREQHALYLERVAAAGRLYGTNQLPAAWHRLDQCPEAHRGWEWGYLDGQRRGGPTELRGHAAGVTAAAFLGDGRLATADRGGEVRVWEVDAATAGRTWPVGGPVTGLDAHPSRPWLAVATAKGVGVWDADAGALVRDLPAARRLAFSPCGRWAAAAGPDGVRVWTLPGWEPARELPDTSGVKALAFTPDGGRLLTGGADGVIRSWNPETAAVVGEPWRRPRPVDGLAFTADGGTLAEAHPEGVVTADPATGRHRHRVDPTAAGRAFLAPGRTPGWLGVVGPNAEVVVWDADRRRPARVFRGHTGPVAALAFAPDGCRLASAGGDKVVRVWDLTADPEVRTLAEPGRAADGLAVSADGRWLAAGPLVRGDRADEVVVLDAATGRERHRLAGTDGIAADPNGRWLAAGRPGGGVVVYDAETGAEKWHRPAPGTGPCGYLLAFSPDGRHLAGWEVMSGRVELWDAETGQPAGGFAGPRALIGPTGFAAGLAFRPDGGQLAFATATGVTVLDATTGEPMGWDEAPRGATAVAYTPDGRGLATADDDHVVRLRDPGSGRVVREFVGTPARVNGLAFRPDGSRLVTGGDDRELRVWEVGSGLELLSLPGLADQVIAVGWSPAGDRVYAIDGPAVRVWPGR